MKNIYRVLMILTCLLLCGSKSAEAADSFTLPCGFVPNVQFAPLYVGLEKGFFAEEGIELTLDHSQEIDTVALVGAGKLPFGICSGEQVLLGRNQGLPLVYIANWYQRYPIGILSLAEKNITGMEDLRGKRVGLPVLNGANYIGLEAMLQQAGMRDSDFDLEVVGYTQSEMLATDRLDAAVIYVANEPAQLEALGYEVNVIRTSDLAAMVGNGLITNQKTIEENPDLVQRMVRAFLRGVNWTKENPDKAYEICKNYVDGLADAADPELQKTVLKNSIALYDDGFGIGVSSESAWENMTEVMKNIGQIASDFFLDGAYTNQYVEQAGE